MNEIENTPQARAAAAWTLAKCEHPRATQEERLQAARDLLQLSTPELDIRLQQTDAGE